MDEFPAPGPGPSGIAWDGRCLWISDTARDRIERVDHGQSDLPACTAGPALDAGMPGDAGALDAGMPGDAGALDAGTLDAGVPGDAGGMPDAAGAAPDAAMPGETDGGAAAGDAGALPGDAGPPFGPDAGAGRHADGSVGVDAGAGRVGASSGACACRAAPRGRMPAFGLVLAAAAFAFCCRRMAWRMRNRVAAGAAAPVATVLAAIALAGRPSLAAATPGMHTLRVEGAAAAIVSEPNASRFDPGGGFGASYELRPVEWLGLEVRYAGFFFGLRQAEEGRSAGTYHAPALGVRVHPAPGLREADFWFGGSGDIVVTGDLVRPGFQIGFGLEIEATWFLRIGPCVRLHHVVQPDDDPRGPSDATFVSFGLSAAFLGDEPAVAHPREPAAAAPPAMEGAPAPSPADACDDGVDCLAPPEQAPPDRDADGVAGERDLCPSDAETPNDYRDEDGCPDEVEREIDRIAEQIFFATDDARLSRAAQASLREVAEVLRAHPEITRVRIEGHADARGSTEHNLDLSERRARAVLAFLVAEGIASERLEVAGYGEAVPQAQGDDEDAHARNRRVQFTVIGVGGRTLRERAP